MDDSQEDRPRERSHGNLVQATLNSETKSEHNIGIANKKTEEFSDVNIINNDLSDGMETKDRGKIDLVYNEEQEETDDCRNDNGDKDGYLNSDLRGNDRGEIVDHSKEVDSELDFANSTKIVMQLDYSPKCGKKVELDDCLSVEETSRFGNKIDSCDHYNSEERTNKLSCNTNGSNNENSKEEKEATVVNSAKSSCNTNVFDNLRNSSKSCGRKQKSRDLNHEEGKYEYSDNELEVTDDELNFTVNDFKINNFEYDDVSATGNGIDGAGSLADSEKLSSLFCSLGRGLIRSPRALGHSFSWSAPENKVIGQDASTDKYKSVFDWFQPKEKRDQLNLSRFSSVFKRQATTETPCSLLASNLKSTNTSKPTESTCFLPQMTQEQDSSSSSTQSIHEEKYPLSPSFSSETSAQVPQFTQTSLGRPYPSDTSDSFSQVSQTPASSSYSSVTPDSLSQVKLTFGNSSNSSHTTNSSSEVAHTLDSTSNSSYTSELPFQRKNSFDWSSNYLYAPESLSQGKQTFDITSNSLYTSESISYEKQTSTGSSNYSETSDHLSQIRQASSCLSQKTHICDSSTHFNRSLNDRGIDNDDPFILEPQPPDGGYGWVVVTATILISIVYPSLSWCYGLVYLQLQKESNQGYTNSQLVGISTLQYGIRHLMGPLSCVLGHRLGSRLVTCLGTALISGSLLMSCFSNQNLVALYIFYGCFGGLGMGLITPQIVLMTQQYFRKRRVAAMALSNLGTSIGSMAMPLLLQFFIDNYQMDLSFMLWSAVILQTMVPAMLLHPVKWHLKLKPVRLNDCQVNRHARLNDSDNNPLKRKQSPSLRKRVRACNCENRLCNSMADYKVPCALNFDGKSNVDDSDKDVTLHEIGDIESSNVGVDDNAAGVDDIHSSNLLTNDQYSDQLFPGSITDKIIGRSWSSPADKSIKSPTKKRSLYRFKSISDNDLNMLPVILEENTDWDDSNIGGDSEEMGGRDPEDGEDPRSSLEDIGRVVYRNNTPLSPIPPTSNRSSDLSTDSFVTCYSFSDTSNSIYCSAELFPVPDTQEQTIPENGTQKKNMWLSIGDIISWIRKNALKLHSSYKDVILNKMFIICCISTSISRLVYANFVIFLPLLGDDLSTTTSESAGNSKYLLTIVSCVELSSKVITAIVSTKTNIKTRHFYITGSLLVIVGCLGAGLSGNFSGLAASSAVFGFGTGMQMSTSTVLLVDALGVDIIVRSYGLSLFFVGIIGLLLMPLGGVLLDITGTYSSSFYLLCCISALPALLWSLGYRIVKRLDDSVADL